MARKNKKADEAMKIQCIVCLMWTFLVDTEEEENGSQSQNYHCKKCKDFELLTKKMDDICKRLEQAEKKLDNIIINDKIVCSKDNETDKHSSEEENLIEINIKELENKIKDLEMDRDLLDLGQTESAIKIKKIEKDIHRLQKEEDTMKKMVEKLTKETPLVSRHSNQKDECLDKRKEITRKEVLIIGDSNVKRLDSFVSDIGREKRKHITLVSLPGGKIMDVKEKIIRIVGSIKAEYIKLFLHVGINDAERGSELILRDIKETIDELKKLNRSLDIVICEIPARKDKGGLLFSRITGVNNTIQRKAGEWDYQVLEVNSTLDRLSAWTHDGVHYNKVAAKEIGGKIRNDIVNFLG